jgi:signal transduction histidine kinase
MRDRIGAIGGNLELTSAPGRGTSLRALVPLG